MRSILIALIFLLGVPDISRAHCLKSQLPEEINPLMNDVWATLPIKMQQTLCSKEIRLSMSKKLVSKDGAGLAVRRLNQIFLRENHLLNALSSEEEYLSAKRNIIHELAHFFFWRHKIDKRELILLAGRTRNGFLLKRNRNRNHYAAASLDHYEFKNEEEFFAVNTELFLTSEEFKCRRPLQYGYLRKIFDHHPFVESRCESTRLLPVTVNGDVRFKELDFKKLHQVHLLLANQGTHISSRFGHAMLRLVFCSPKASHASEDCVGDIGSHYVLSFRANVTDPKTNLLSGLLGGYESQMHILPYKEVIEEYAGIEKRGLTNYPLVASSFSIERLKELIFDQAWTYRGKYKFLSNNCGTELLSFLQLLITSVDLSQVQSQTPGILLLSLRRKGIIQTLNNPDLKVSAQRSQAELQFAQIQPYIRGVGLEEFLALNPKVRKDLITTVPHSKIHAAILVQFQNSIIAKKQRLLWNRFLTELEHDEDESARLRGFFPQDGIVPKGIPTQLEVASIQIAMSRGLHPELLSAIRAMFPQEYDEIKQEVFILDSIIKTFFSNEDL